MAKICILGDTHWGARNDNQNFYDYQKKFVDKVLIPAIMDNGCTHFIHLGDLVDNRRQINVQTAKRLREDFLIPLRNIHFSRNLECHFILGNHDIYYKNNKEVNALKEILPHSTFPFHTYETPRCITIDNKSFLMLPWITPESRENDFVFVKHNPSDYCMSHLELKGFEQTKGRLAAHGDDSEIFKEFGTVFSGHYHRRSFRDNIFYVGSPFQFNWGDIDNVSGCVILDTDDGSILEIKNPYSMFNIINYDEDAGIPKLDKKIHETFVRINVVNKKSETKFNKFVEEVHNIGIADLLINENLPPLVISKLPIKANTTLEIFNDTISSIDFHDKDGLKYLLEEVYKEAMSVQ